MNKCNLNYINQRVPSMIFNNTPSALNNYRTPSNPQSNLKPHPLNLT